MRTLRTLAVAGAGLLLAAGLTRAAPYEFVLKPSSGIVGSGGVVTVEAYLRQNPAEGGTLLTTEGLFGAGVLLRQVGGAATATVASAAGIQPNPLLDAVVTYPFDAAFPDPSGTPLAGFLGFTTGAVPLTPPLGSDEVFLGSFDVTLGGMGATAFLGLFQVDSTAGFDELVTFTSMTVLDPDTADASTSGAAVGVFEVVPEPSALALVGAALAALTVWRRRRAD